MASRGVGPKHHHHRPVQETDKHVDHKHSARTPSTGAHARRPDSSFDAPRAKQNMHLLQSQHSSSPNLDALSGIYLKIQGGDVHGGVNDAVTLAKKQPRNAEQILGWLGQNLTPDLLAGTDPKVQQAVPLLKKLLADPKVSHDIVRFPDMDKFVNAFFKKDGPDTREICKGLSSDPKLFEHVWPVLKTDTGEVGTTLKALGLTSLSGKSVAQIATALPHLYDAYAAANRGDIGRVSDEIEAATAKAPAIVDDVLPHLWQSLKDNPDIQKTLKENHLTSLTTLSGDNAKTVARVALEVYAADDAIRKNDGAKAARLIQSAAQHAPSVAATLVHKVLPQLLKNPDVKSNLRDAHLLKVLESPDFASVAVDMAKALPQIFKTYEDSANNASIPTMVQDLADVHRAAPALLSTLGPKLADDLDDPTLRLLAKHPHVTGPLLNAVADGQMTVDDLRGSLTNPLKAPAALQEGLKTILDLDEGVLGAGIDGLGSLIP